jgi:hypothetical protein
VPGEPSGKHREGTIVKLDCGSRVIRIPGDTEMGVIRGLVRAIGGLLAGIGGLVRGLFEGIGRFLRRLL